MTMYNILFGRNPMSRLLLAMLNLTESDTGRFRDCYLTRVPPEPDGGELHIAIYTRNGGGNRDDYQEVTARLQAHPQYVSDTDDDFDATYALYVFTVPEKFKATVEELAGLGALPAQSPAERFEALLNKLDSEAHQNDPDVRRAVAVGREIFSKVEGLTKSDASAPCPDSLSKA